MSDDDSSSFCGSDHSKNLFAPSTAAPSVSHNDSDDSNKSVQHKIGAVESRRVLYSKVLVFAVLTLSTVLTGYFTYWLTSEEERKSFEGDFVGLASEIIAVVEQKEHSIDSVMNQYSVMLTSTALGLNQTWPYVRIPNFERRTGATLRALSGAYSAAMTLAVPGGSEQAKEDWNDYIDQHKDWYYESCEVANLKPGVFPENYTIAGPTTPPELLSLTMSSPPYQFTRVYKMDLTHHQYPRLQYMRETHRNGRSPVIGSFNRLIESEKVEDPVHFYYEPIFDNFSNEKQVVGYMNLLLRWKDYFSDILHDSAVGVIVELQNNYNQTFTYRIDGINATYIGEGEFHDPQYEHLGIPAGINVDLEEFLNGTSSESGFVIGYTMTIYPSMELRQQYATDKPMRFTLGAVLIFVFTSAVFVFYDCLVQQRQEKVLTSAERTEAIVSDLFPSQFRDQLFESQNNKDAKKQDTFRIGNTNKNHLRQFMDGGIMDDQESHIAASLSLTKPVADLFPHCTVMFADIVNFTAWSSMREPSQVFTLLESIYRAFDDIAKKRKVFKVETVGDSYVAVCGVPEQRKDHVTVMTRYARECLMVLPKVTLELERFLGPGTGELTMRFGVHSGQVTAGVLRGEKARLQLFGDTVNTAARIESTGVGGRVHLSEQTAKLLIQSGKGRWVEQRDDIVHAKGKGDMQTYWLRTSTGSQAPSIMDRSNHSIRGFDGGEPSKKYEWANLRSIKGSDHTKRLVGWNVVVLKGILKQIVASRGGRHCNAQTRKATLDLPGHTDISGSPSNATVPLDEVAEIIMLPGFDSKKSSHTATNYDDIDLEASVEYELFKFVTRIAASYPANPFHNFEHASHVAMSVYKLLSRIVAPDMDLGDVNEQQLANGREQLHQQYASKLHDHTYGITSDPLTQFAVVLSALIHDVEHPAVPNGQLAKENPQLAAKYKNKSVAEQNSVDVAWSILMSDDFENLRGCIYTNQEEYKRFRQIVVNNVMATDIFDKELGALRKRRWDAAFRIGDSAALVEESPLPETDPQVDVNRKATIVIEHILQASDVAHTMQHWHIYTKWNERLFQEMYLAYINGRSEKDPSQGWYKGEIWFFDNYIIPLAKKLDSCGVFGVSSDEYLSWAVQNRKEWETKGQDIVAEMVEKYAKPPHDSVEIDKSLLPVDEDIV